MGKKPNQTKDEFKKTSGLLGIETWFMTGRLFCPFLNKRIVFLMQNKMDEGETALKNTTLSNRKWV